MSSNLDNHKSSVRDIAKLFAEEKRLGTKAADLVNGTALTKCLEINTELTTGPAEGWLDLTTRVFYSELLLHRSAFDTRCIDSNIREWEIHI